MKKITIFIFFALSTLFVSAQTTYNITDFGAIGDGKTVATIAINQAITECSKNGGGRVVIPSGEFVSGTIFMKDNIEIYLESGATLLASTNTEDMPLIEHTDYRSLKDWYGWAALIYADGANNIAITGNGTIDGQGENQPSRPELPKGDMDGRCRNILFISCKNIRIEGIKMYHSGLWNQHYLNCEDLFVDNIYVDNNKRKNNDGIDIDGCRRVVVSNSIIDANDDAVVIKSTGEALCEDVTITNCVLSSWCNGIKAGTESTGGFRNIAISNCVIKPTTCPTNFNHNKFITNICFTGISLEIVDGGIMEAVAINNIITEGVQAPLFIRLGNRARKHLPDAPEPKIGTIRNITVNNMIAYDVENVTSSISAVEGACIENVTISNIQFRNNGGVSLGNEINKLDHLESVYDVEEMADSYPEAIKWGNLPASIFFLRRIKNIIIKDVTVTPLQEDSRTPIIAHDVKGIILGDFILSDNITAPIFFKGYDVEDYKIEKPLGWRGEVSTFEKFMFPTLPKNISNSNSSQNSH
ncbi:MAG: glycosyl hydrolase family 28 protein [Rikenellaceae bacterium]